MVVSIQSLSVEALIPSFLDVGPLEGNEIMRGINALIRREPQRCSLPHAHVSTQQEGGYLQIRKKALTVPQICLIMDLPASGTVRNIYLLFKPPSIFVFATMLFLL